MKFDTKQDITASLHLDGLPQNHAVNMHLDEINVHLENDRPQRGFVSVVAAIFLIVSLSITIGIIVEGDGWLYWILGGVTGLLAGWIAR